MKPPNPETNSINFEDHVIFRLDFTKNIDTSEKRLKKFESRIEEKFSHPLIEPRKSFEFTTSPQGNIFKDGTVKFYKFTNESGSQQVSLEPGALAVAFFSQVSPEELLSTLKLILNGFKEAYEPMDAKRTGLRHTYKIEKQEKKPFDWKDLISSCLVSPIEFYPDSNDLSRVISLIEFTKEGFRVSMQAGLGNMTDYPGHIVAEEFTLDYDCFTFEEKRGVAPVLELIPTFNSQIMTLLDLSTTDKLKGIMEEKKYA